MPKRKTKGKSKANKTSESLLGSKDNPKNRKNKSKGHKNDNSHNEEIDSESQSQSQSQSKPMTMKKKLWWIAVGIAIIGSLIMLRINQEQYGWSGIEREGDIDGNQETSYYEILEVSNSASTIEIKKAYKKLAMKYHPDRNRNCGSHCEEMTSKINKAYEILSNESKRKIYDATSGSIKSIASGAIELTYENFNDHVIYSRGLFVIQVYTEWFKECTDFSPIWEEAVHKFSSYVQFGRIHGDRQMSIVKKLGTAIRDYPTVVSFVDGQFLRAYPAVRYPQDLFDLIVQDYPTKHLLIANEDTFHKKLYNKWLKKQNIPLLMIASKKIQPSLLVSWLARQYENIIQFAHLYPKPMSKKGAQNSINKVSKARPRFLSKKISEYFGTPTITDLPTLITVSNNGEAEIIDEPINKYNLEKFTSRFVGQMIPELSTWTYTRICTKHDIICILYIIGCDKINNTNNNKNKNETNKDYLLEFKSLSDFCISQFKDIEESYHPKWIQFAYTDIRESQNHELIDLCINSNTQVIIINEAATTLTEMDNKLNNINKEDYWEWIKNVLEHEFDTPILDAPRIIPPRPERMSYFEMISEWIEEFDWRDPDMQLNIAIITILIAGFYILKYIGVAGCVWFIFALSIFGGLFQTFLFKGTSGPQPGSRGGRGGGRSRGGRK